MSSASRVAGFLVVLAAVFAVTLGVGRAIGPGASPDSGTHDHSAAEGPAQAAAGAADELPGGLMVAQDGYTLALNERRAVAGRAVPVAFTITGPDGQPVTSYDVRHDKRLHLIAVRRDLTGFQHVHPALRADGTWTTTLDLTPGQWRLFADLKPRGTRALTLGADLAVPGDYRPEVRERESRTARVGAFAVTLDGELDPGSDASLTLSVTRAGTPVTDLQPYLGAYGHLVALRAGDLAYLHVHPDGTPDDESTQPGPDVTFTAAVPSSGTYHLYLDFKHDGVVRTAEFTVHTGRAGDGGRDTGDTGDTGTGGDTGNGEDGAHAGHGGH